MSLVLVLLGLLVAGYGATAAVALLAASRLALTRWVARHLEGADAAATALSRPGDIAAAGEALVALGIAVAGVAAPWALEASAVATTLVVEVLLGVPLLALAAYFLPRAIGRRWPEAVVRAVVPRLKPAGAIVGRIVRGRAATERAELAALLRDGAAEGLAREDELEIVTGVMAFADRPVRDVMTPRTRVAAAPEGTPTEELARLVVSSGYTRLPIYRHSLDEIVGMVHAFDLIKAAPGVAGGGVGQGRSACGPSRTSPPRPGAPMPSSPCGAAAGTSPWSSTNSAGRPGCSRWRISWSSSWGRSSTSRTSLPRTLPTSEAPWWWMPPIPSSA